MQRVEHSDITKVDCRAVVWRDVHNTITAARLGGPEMIVLVIERHVSQVHAVDLACCVFVDTSWNVQGIFQKYGEHDQADQEQSNDSDCSGEQEGLGFTSLVATCSGVRDKPLSLRGLS